jgi:hypothetical protein
MNAWRLTCPVEQERQLARNIWKHRGLIESAVFFGNLVKVEEKDYFDLTWK